MKYENEFLNDEFLDDKVVLNTLIIPVFSYLLGFSYVSIFLVVFYAFGYLFLIKYLDFTKNELEHKRYSYFSILLGVYLPALLFFMLLSQNHF